MSAQQPSALSELRAPRGGRGAAPGARARAHLVGPAGRAQAAAGKFALPGQARSEGGGKGGARRSVPGALRRVLACSH